MREPRRTDPVRDEELGVFVPALMGVGVIVSGVLVLADWLAHLMPNGRIRRRQRLATGAKGLVVSVARAAGVEVVGPDYETREWRPRLVYLIATAVFAALGGAGLAAGLMAYNDAAGLFYRNPWMIGMGVGSAAVLGLLSLQLVFFAIVHRRSFRAAHVLVETTWFGRLKPPPDAPAEFARSLRVVKSKGKKP